MLRKLSIYAALLVPEVWRYDGRTVQIYELTDKEYVGIDEIRFLPGLTGALLGEHLEWSKAHGQTKSLEALGRHFQTE